MAIILRYFAEFGKFPAKNGGNVRNRLGSYVNQRRACQTLIWLMNSSQQFLTLVPTTMPQYGLCVLSLISTVIRFMLMAMN